MDMRLWKVTLFLCFFGIANVALGAGRLHAMLSSNAESGRNIENSSIVELRIENTGDRSIEIRDINLPATQREGYLTQDIFDVVDEAGKHAAYKGIIVDFISVEKDSYLALKSGQRKIYKVDIAKNYALEGDRVYSVKIKHSLSYLDRPINQVLAQDLKSLRSSYTNLEVAAVVIYSGSSKATPSLF